MLPAAGKDRFSRARAGSVMALCLGVFLCETEWRPPRLYPTPPLQSTLAQTRGPILELPFTPSTLSGYHLYHQTIHHQPIFIAEFSRLSKFKARYLENYPALAILNRIAWNETLTPDEEIFVQNDFCKEIERLNASRIFLQRGVTSASDNLAARKRLAQIERQCQAFQEESQDVPAP